MRGQILLRVRLFLDNLLRAGHRLQVVEVVRGAAQVVLNQLNVLIQLLFLLLLKIKLAIALNND